MCTPKVRRTILTLGVFFVVKYDEGFKQKVVDAYLAGEGGYASLAIRFGIRSKTNIRKWVSVFQQFGKQGLAPKKAITNYPVQFKLDVLNYKVRTGDSLEEVARKFGITEPPMILNWLRKWQNEGIEGLSKSKGRPSMSNKPKKNKNDEGRTIIKRNRMTTCGECLFKKAPSFRDKYSEPTAKTESRVIYELRKEFKLAVILEATGFPKATYMWGKNDLMTPIQMKRLKRLSKRL
nr:helix-turn-helix domain-containing protein [Heyndrickxia ginsengihumi]